MNKNKQAVPNTVMKIGLNVAIDAAHETTNRLNGRVTRKRGAIENSGDRYMFLTGEVVEVRLRGRGRHCAPICILCCRRTGLPNVQCEHHLADKRIALQAMVHRRQQFC